MPRFHLSPADWDAGRGLSGDEAHHAAQVHRVLAGDLISIFDGAGRRATARVTASSRNRVEFEIQPESLQTSAPEIPALHLAVGIPKGKIMDLVVQKAVELGIARITPLVTRNTIVQPGNGKSAKWRRIALEACKQCGQDRLPEIDDCTEFSGWLANRPPSPLSLVGALETAAPSLRGVLESVAEPPPQITWLVGPEGDFTSEELNAARMHGFQGVGLGPMVLRVETAVMFGLAAIRYRFLDGAN